ncbi:hypothetical protein EW026_g391 [Hermanssonia centrifuga]|uniref:Bromodomain-containing protein n=1 Tax=Hermanssonia centrifuga TaxID=98765 RepID=A0A4S4KUQ1_9APHY|nr:hypothetical protein EW026_g391 [Hermanssonia centrifuga]
MSDAPLTNVLHLNGNHHSLNGSDLNTPNGVADSAPDSPAIDSPATPIDNSLTSDDKIDVHLNDPEESDVRHDTIPMKVDKLDNASTVPQVATPVDPVAVIPIDPPNGTPPPAVGDLLEDVKMAEEPEPVNVDDVHMAEVDTSIAVDHPKVDVTSPPATVSSSFPPVPSSTTVIEAVDASSPYSNNSPNDDDIQPPPAKRARMHSDADEASLANTATPPPASLSPPAEQEETEPTPNGNMLSHSGPPTFSVAQHRFFDPIALGIPHYPSVIKHPMDFSTVERKLQASSPTKPDSNPVNPRYHHADEFIADVRLIFNNSLTFNGPDHFVTKMSKQLEEVFDKQLKTLPAPEVHVKVKPPVVKKPSPPPPPPPVKKPARRQSTSVPVIRRTEEPSGRPKREIHPPPPKDLPYADVPKKLRKAKVPKNDGVAEQLRFCDKVLRDLNKKSHYSIAHPFYEPVDWVKLEIPAYPKLIKKPMDLATMRRKLDGSEYSTADEFYDDFKQMIWNCSKFNPPGTPVHLCGNSLDALFNEKWKHLPIPRPNVASEDEDSEDDENSEDDRQRIIKDMEAQVEAMNRTLAGLKQNKMKEKKGVKKEKREKAPPVASTSKATPKANGKKVVNSKKNVKKPITDDDVLSFEQKKELSDTIGKLDGTKLERVIQIIHEGVPEIRDSTEEIELEIDTLPAGVLTKLYNFVIRPTRAPPVKRGRTGKGTGTGGLKRKSMDEDVEAEKIRVLEERMALFDKGGQASSAAPRTQATATHGDDSEHSSDSSSDDSSGSDSE